MTVKQDIHNAEVGMISKLPILLNIRNPENRSNLDLKTLSERTAHQPEAELECLIDIGAFEATVQKLTQSKQPIEHLHLHNENVGNDEDLTTTNSAKQNLVSGSDVFAFAKYEEDSLGLYSQGLVFISGPGSDEIFKERGGNHTIFGFGGDDHLD
jgi:hypothetical protein